MCADKTEWVLDRVLRQRAEATPDRPFLEVVGDRCETYGETLEAASRLASRLVELGVGQGDTVVIMAPNSFEAVHGWIAVNMLGAIDVTINTAYRGHLLEHALNMAEARIMLLDEQFLPVLRESEANLPHLETAAHFRTTGTAYEAPPPAFERLALLPLWGNVTPPPADAADRAVFSDIASVIYTSGTTGPAKGVMMPHAQTHQLAWQTVQMLRMGEDDVMYCFHPLFHMAAKFMGVYSSMLAGGKVVLDARFTAENWLARVRKYGATVGLAHGPMIELIHDQPVAADDADNPMRRIMACPFPKRIAAEFEERFDLRGFEVWGMTEINVPCWHPYDAPLKVGSCGRIVDDWVEFQIVDPETDEPVTDGEVGEFIVRHKEPWVIWGCPRRRPRPGGTSGFTAAIWAIGMPRAGSTSSTASRTAFAAGQRISLPTTSRWWRRPTRRSWNAPPSASPRSSSRTMTSSSASCPPTTPPSRPRI
jgi:crotonobetaine/carnitine-CoA ligase